MTLEEFCKKHKNLPYIDKFKAQYTEVSGPHPDVNPLEADENTFEGNYGFWVDSRGFAEDPLTEEQASECYKALGIDEDT